MNILKAEIRSRLAYPRDDLLSDLASSTDNGNVLSDDELLAMTFLLYVAGHETTTHLLSVSLLTLLREPGAREQLTLPLSEKAVSELVRYTSPVQMSKPRFVTQTLELGGVTLNRGDTIAVLIGAVNSDPDWIDSAQHLDLQRSGARHMGFGGGAHVCLGLQLALRETATILNQLFERFPRIALHSSNALPAWNRRLGLRSLDKLRVNCNGT